MLPLVEEVMTVPEWEALNERGRSGMPKNRQLCLPRIPVAGQHP